MGLTSVIILILINLSLIKWKRSNHQGNNNIVAEVNVVVEKEVIAAEEIEVVVAVVKDHPKINYQNNKSDANVSCLMSQPTATKKHVSCAQMPCCTSQWAPATTKMCVLSACCVSDFSCSTRNAQSVKLSLMRSS